MAKRNLQGTVVLITGAARGIGLATAQALSAQGAVVSLGDIDGELAASAARGLGGYGGYLDVRERRSFAAFVAVTRQRLGPIDVLVNNAGIMPMGPFLDETPALTDAQIDINLRGVIHGMQAVLPEMLARGRGHIVNIASLAGRFAIPGAVVYTGTKFAVVGLTEAAAAEYRGRGVDFSAILPSKVRTELASGTAAAGKGIPAVAAEEVAQAVLQALHKPRLFVAVPGYLSTAAALYPLVPAWLMNLGRRALRDDRILTRLDRNDRATYEQRLAALATAATAAAPTRRRRRTPA